MRVLGDLTLEPLRLAATSGSSTRSPTLRAGTRVLLLRRAPAARLRELVRRADPAEARLALARSSATRMLGVVRRWLEPPYALDGWRIDVANMAGRFRDVDLNHEVARGIREAVAGGRAGRRRARPRLPAGPAARRLARRHELRRFPPARLERGCEATTSPRSCARLLGHPRGLPSLDGAQAVRTMRLPRRRALATVLHSWPLLDSHDVATLPHGQRPPRPAARRHRLADDDARACRWSSPATSSGSRASGARMRAGRCPGPGRRRGTRPAGASTGG